MARREHECPVSSLHALVSSRLLGTCFPFLLGSLGLCGFGLQDIASSSVVIDKYNDPSPSASQKNHRDQDLISRPGRVRPVPQSNAGGGGT